MIRLLDGNLLVAMALVGHVHRERSLKWFSKGFAFATCPVTEGTLLRVHMALAEDRSSEAAWRTLRKYRRHARHEFWQDNFSYADIEPAKIKGHRQVTDAWLVELARRRSGKLATLDEGLATLFPETVELVTT